MSYDDAIEATVTRAQALREIGRHDTGESLADFFATYGDQAEYRGADVLAWLGY